MWSLWGLREHAWKTEAGQEYYTQERERWQKIVGKGTSDLPKVGEREREEMGMLGTASSNNISIILN